MAEVRWTPLMIEERLVEAADVLKRLPEVRVQGDSSVWPAVVHEFGDLVGQGPPPHLQCRSPTPDLIARMEETLGWTMGLDPVDVKIVWLRASGERWKTICSRVGLARAAAHEHWLYALCAIAWRLNGRRLSRHASKRRVIAKVRAAGARVARRKAPCRHFSLGQGLPQPRTLAADLAKGPLESS